MRLRRELVTREYANDEHIFYSDFCLTAYNTANIEFSGWGHVFGDPNMAAAIHHGRMIRFEGDSWRQTHALIQ